MDINCPYCGARYELDDSLLPEGDIKVKCRVCSNVFILNKNSGAFKDEPQVSAEAQTPVHSSPQAQTSGSAPASFDSSKHPVSDDFMQSIMSEINSAVAEEASGKNKKDSGSGSVSAPSSSPSKTTSFQIIMLIILAVLFLIAAASALVHYNIINIPFLPSGVAAFLSSF
jgi:predicted Zn finger-like uncharacterized protein